MIGTCPAPINIRKAFLWVRAAGNKYVVMANGGVYTFDGTTWIDVTPTGWPALFVHNPKLINNTFEWSWFACQSGISVIISNPQIGPYYLNDGVVKFTALPYDGTQSWQGKGISPYVIRSHKEFLIALGY